MATLTLRPNSAGTYQEMIAYPVGSSHYSVTSDQNDNTFVYATAQSKKEIENLDDTAQTGTINSVTVYIRASADGTGAKANTLIRTNNANKIGASKSLTLTMANYSDVYTKNPITGNAWTWDEINALQAGATSGTLGTGTEEDFAEFWAVVDYTPPPAAVAQFEGDGLTFVIT